MSKFMRDDESPYPVVADYYEMENLDPNCCYIPMFREKGKQWQYNSSVSKREFFTLKQSVDCIKFADDAFNKGKTTSYRIAKIQKRTPTPEEVSWVKDFKAIKSNSPKWVEVSESTHDEALGAVPPIYLRGGGFAMGEAERWNEKEKATEYNCFVRSKGKYWGCQATIRIATETKP